MIFGFQEFHGKVFTKGDHRVPGAAIFQGINRGPLRTFWDGKFAGRYVLIGFRSIAKKGRRNIRVMEFYFFFVAIDGHFVHIGKINILIHLKLVKNPISAPIEGAISISEHPWIMIAMRMSANDVFQFAVGHIFFQSLGNRWGGARLRSGIH